MLVLDDLTVRFDDTVAVRGVDLSLPAGEVLAVLGPSGCGKSTLLRAVAGLEPAYSGTVTYDGQDLAGVPVHKRGFALMFQDGQLFAHHSVGRNVGYPLRLRRTPRVEVRAVVAELLELVGLPGFEQRMPGTLSGGERQRVALARALAVRPRLLLLDEPLSALDAALRERLAADLREILRRAGTTALLVTHDQEEAFAVADAMAVMRAGEVVQSGSVEAVWQHPADAWTARFLGYSTVLDPDRAALLLGRTPAGPLALRRSALRVAPEGPVAATVRSARATPEQVRLRVEVAGLGELEAVAGRDVVVGVGEEIRLAVDRSRCATLADDPAGEHRRPSAAH